LAKEAEMAQTMMLDKELMAGVSFVLSPSQYFKPFLSSLQDRSLADELQQASDGGRRRQPDDRAPYMWGLAFFFDLHLSPLFPQSKSSTLPNGKLGS